MAGSPEGLNKRRRSRKCVGCGNEYPKTSMLRITRDPDGRIYMDVSGRAQGRGAYICLDSKCLLMARKKNAFSRVLKRAADISLYDEISVYLEGKTDE